MQAWGQILPTVVIDTTKIQLFKQITTVQYQLYQRAWL